MCGCGEDAPIADRNDRKRGRVKGEPLRFVQGHNRRRERSVPAAKWCSACDSEMRADQFYFDKSKPDGLSSTCKSCRKKNARAWYGNNRERHRELSRRWKAEHLERDRELKARWQREHPKQRAEAERRRTVRLRDGRIEKIDPWEIYKRDGGRCHICGRRVAKKDMSLDHLVPVSKGGDHVRTNVRLAHLACNVRRGAGRTPAQLLLT